MVNSERNALRATLRQKFPRNRGELLPALHFLQHEFGWLPDWAMEVVGWHLGVPASEVYGAATSYTELRVTKPGTHIVRVCVGLGCRYAGGAELMARLRDTFGGGASGSAPDAASNVAVAVEETPCAFICAVAPAVEVDGELYGRVSQDALDTILREREVTP